MDNIKNKILHYFKINFCYNGDLGKLQTITQQNLKFLDTLLASDMINFEEFKETKEQIQNYFKQELEKVVNNIANYLF